MLLALLTLLGAVPAAAVDTQDLLRDQEPAFIQTCHDGQKVVAGTNPCDTDDKADGFCTFGEKGTHSIRVAVGKTQKSINSCEVVGQFTCEPPAVMPPTVIVPGGVPTAGASADAPAKKKAPLGECRFDSDCVATSGNGCIRRGTMRTLEDPNNTNVLCRCMKGPAAFGCVPRGSSYESLGRRVNRDAAARRH